ncbi:MAG: AMP-binding protein [Candidatus Kapaibacterium sp.]|jgi:acyl-CoA synthetase (AMP-forming)/AMP-acid ligase II
MELYEAALGNVALKFIDGESGAHSTLGSLPQIHTDPDDTGLVFVYCDNTIESVAAFWSLMSQPHTLALLPRTLAPQLKLTLENRYKPRYIIDSSRAQVDGYSATAQNTSTLFRADNPAKYSIHPSVKVLLSTSGTTGSPKFVKLSEQNLLSNAKAIALYLPMNSNDVTPLNLPIHYSYGLSVLTANAIGGGAIATIPYDILRPEFWRMFTELGCTSIAGVPYVYEMLKRIGFLTKQYPALRYCTQAGGRLKDSLIREFAEYGLANNVLFYVMYGATEATARMSYLHPSLLPDKCGSIGKPIPGGSFAIDNATEELLYSGPNVFGGYAESYHDLHFYDAPEWLHTGDIATTDSDGYYYIKGRSKRIVKLFGNRVNLDELEVFVSTALSATVKCTGSEDAHVVVWCCEDSVDSTAVKQCLQQEFKLHPSVVRFQHLDAFPLTSAGKIDYMALTERSTHD